MRGTMKSPEHFKGLDAEGRRAAEEGLSEDEYALFCLLQKENLRNSDREKVKLASRSLLEAVSKLIAQRERWTEKEQTQADVEVLILDHVFFRAADDGKSVTYVLTHECYPCPDHAFASHLQMADGKLQSYHFFAVP